MPWVCPNCMADLEESLIHECIENPRYNVYLVNDELEYQRKVEPGEWDDKWICLEECGQELEGWTEDLVKENLTAISKSYNP